MAAGSSVYAPLGIEFVSVLLSAIKPYTLWLIVILVSLISFIGYVLIKLMGSSVGVGLTGLVGGLISSTATTLSFSRRSLERPQLNYSFGVAILLASSVMFPRLLLEMVVVNRCKRCDQYGSARLRTRPYPFPLRAMLALQTRRGERWQVTWSQFHGLAGSDARRRGAKPTHDETSPA